MCLELKKAFDMNATQNLLTMLNISHIKGLSHVFFLSYLKHRKKYNSNNKVSSNIYSIGMGARQCSKIGPLVLFSFPQ